MDKLRILTISLTSDYNPLTWTEQDLLAIVSNQVIVGYILKNKSTPILNLYVIHSTTVSEPNKIVTHTMLQNIYSQWLESLNEAGPSYMFRNPPVEEWLETKDNWIKKTADKLAKAYDRPYDDCVSTLYMTILNCYNKGTVYLGNLHYFVISVNNELKLEHRYMLNRLHGGHPDAVHLDAAPSNFNQSLENSVSSLHELVSGLTDADAEEERHAEILAEILEDLKADFTPREIDQILYRPGYLPMPLYRKLLKWRKTHTLEDYL